MKKNKPSFQKDKIIIVGARQNNLKDIDVEIPKNKLVVVTGLSGSGKSSLVFDTLYAEGQRRYVESLSSYARQFLEKLDKPDVDHIIGITPAIAIEQKTVSKNARSTVATSTELYDYLRLLYARIGKTYCFICGKEVKKHSVGSIIKELLNYEESKRCILCFPIQFQNGKSEELLKKINLLRIKGYFRFLINGEIIDLNENEIKFDIDSKIYAIVSRFKIEKKTLREKIADALETAFRDGEGKLSVYIVDDKTYLNFSNQLECCGVKYQEPVPNFFSFNNPLGACPVCQGFGKTMGIDYDLVIPNKSMTLREGAIAAFSGEVMENLYYLMLEESGKYNIPLDKPIEDFSEKEMTLLRAGFGKFPGIDGFFKELEKNSYKLHYRVLLSRYRSYTECYSCKGSRLRREVLYVKIADKTIADILRMSIENARAFFENLKLSDYDYEIAKLILDEIKKRLNFLYEVGLGYLHLDRLSRTLSGGESQRINLATSLGSALRGVLYALDEPSIGLHPRDNERLINILKKLRDLNNTVVVVEHDESMIKSADVIIDMGPGSGENGGQIVFQGSYNDLLNCKESLTAKYLTGKKQILSSKKISPDLNNSIKIIGARANNIKNLNAQIPLNCFCAVVGVSGSGKSTFVYDIVYSNIARAFGKSSERSGRVKQISGYENLNDIVIVDQKPIGASSRSNPASYIGVFDHIREIFSQTPEAKRKGLSPRYFSFNINSEGRCPVCEGSGYIKIDMQFLSDVYIKCEECEGSRYKKEVREILYKDKSIVDVLNITVSEAYEFFSEHKKILKYFDLLKKIGLDYLRLGQPSNTLSGGESQRLKLAYILANIEDAKNTLIIMDEPTTGLHFEDINKLLATLDILKNKGASLLIIEHNLDIIKNADYVIEFGPEAGDNGGKIVFSGTIDEMIAKAETHTANFLRKKISEDLSHSGFKLSKAN